MIILKSVLLRSIIDAPLSAKSDSFTSTGIFRPVTQIRPGSIWRHQTEALSSFRPFFVVLLMKPLPPRRSAPPARQDIIALIVFPIPQMPLPSGFRPVLRHLRS